jgi:SAM-dependent methyltransferase
MREDDLQAQIEAAEAYDSLFVPALFGEWAPRVADAAALRPGARVLDVACGTGVLAREAADRVGAVGSVVGLDAAPGMLAVAERKAPGLEWRRGVAESLPFDDDAFDAVVSQFGLMFFRDRAAAVGEMHRVLAPGGRAAVAVWDSLANTPAYAASVALLDRVAGRPAAEALSAPYDLGDPEELRKLFVGAGFSNVDISTQRGATNFPSVRVMSEADLRGWLPLMGVVLDESTIQEILEEAETVLAPYVTDEGKVVSDAPAHVVTAWD